MNQKNGGSHPVSCRFGSNGSPICRPRVCLRFTRDDQVNERNIPTSVSVFERSVVRFVFALIEVASRFFTRAIQAFQRKSDDAYQQAHRTNVVIAIFFAVQTRIAAPNIFIEMLRIFLSK
jgi:hypothetical protein